MSQRSDVLPGDFTSKLIIHPRTTVVFGDTNQTELLFQQITKSVESFIICDLEMASIVS